MSKVLGFIPDGYTREGYIKGDPNLYPPVEFTYRPMTAMERRQCDDQIEAATGSEAERVAAAQMAKKITKWDLKNPDGIVVKITADNLCRLQPVLSIRMFQMIRGFVPPDPRPDSDVQDEQPPAVTEETDAKN